MSEVGDGDSCETEQGSLWNLMLYLQVDNVRIELSCLMVWEDRSLSILLPLLPTHFDVLSTIL